jgi:tetrahydromethanopterin S-methyltransferase subunit E
LRLLGFDGQAWIQLLGGLVVGLIALYSSYDHINFGQARVQLEQQWGIWCIIASLAIVVIDAQLASRSRRREEDRRIEDARTAAEESGVAPVSWTGR